MTRLFKFLKAIGLIIKNPWLLNNVINDQKEQQRIFEKKYGANKNLPCINILTLFPDFKETVSPFSFSEGGSTPLDLALLRKIAARYNDAVYFEIGTWRGESVANVAPIVKQAYTLNLSDEELLKLNLPSSYVNQHRMFSKHHTNVEHLFSDSKQFDFSKFYKKIDLVFVDGDHHYEAVKRDTENAFKMLKNERSVIVWHDYGNTPADIRWDVLNGIMDGTPLEFRNKLYRVSNTLCAIFIQDELPFYVEQQNSPPNKIFEIAITANPIK